MKRLLALSTLPRGGPSVRPRVLAYEAALRDAGIGMTFSPFLSDPGFAGFYCTELAARVRKALFGAAGLLRRVSLLSRAGRFDGALVHREILPRGNRRAIRAVRRSGLRLGYDLDDAIYLSPRDYVEEGELSRRRMSRIKDPGDVDRFLEAADLVLAGNETIAEHARNFCADVRVQPTPVDTAVFRPRERPERSVPLVGWIGSPTAAYCLGDIVPALERVGREEEFELLVVGAGERVRVPGVRVRNRPWKLDEEAGRFASLDVGLYPLPDNPWTRGKCGMKALQYGASGVPAVVSPVGVNREMVEDGETGFFASSADEWSDRLLAYLRDGALRRRHGEAARRRVAARWSLDALTPAYVRAMEDLLR